MKTEGIFSAIRNLKSQCEVLDLAVMSIEVNTPTFYKLCADLSLSSDYYNSLADIEPGKLVYNGVEILKRECTCGAYKK